MTRRAGRRATTPPSGPAWTAVGSQPPCRPASVACSVATSGSADGRPRARSPRARPASRGRGSRRASSPTGRCAPRSMRVAQRRWPRPRRSRLNSRCGGSSATRRTRTPSTRLEGRMGVGVGACGVAGDDHHLVAPRPPAPSRRACTCRPSPPTTTRGIPRRASAPACRDPPRPFESVAFDVLSGCRDGVTPGRAQSSTWRRPGRVQVDGERAQASRPGCGRTSRRPGRGWSSPARRSRRPAGHARERARRRDAGVVRPRSPW